MTMTHSERKTLLVNVPKVFWNAVNEQSTCTEDIEMKTHLGAIVPRLYLNCWSNARFVCGSMELKCGRHHFGDMHLGNTFLPNGYLIL